MFRFIEESCCSASNCHKVPGLVDLAYVDLGSSLQDSVTTYDHGIYWFIPLLVVTKETLFAAMPLRGAFAPRGEW